jgi:hypothetical protein
LSSDKANAQERGSEEANDEHFSDCSRQG